jgi:hypothetical protein
LRVPDGPGLGVNVNVKKLKEFADAGFSSATWTWEELKQF